MLKAIASAFISCALTLLGAEGAARLALTHMDFGDCYVASRNPHFRRAWPEFTRPRSRPDNTRLLIVISNSQGFSRERTDGNLCYAKLLETFLREQDPQHDYIVANWSIPGGHGPEMVVLAARAAAHDPDGIILVSYGRNFTSAHLSKPLSFGISDVDLLAYTRDVRPLLPEWFLDKFRVDETAKWLESRLGLFRCRNVLSEPRAEKWTWRIREPTRDFKTIQLKAAGSWSPASDRLLACFADVAQRGSPNAELIIVNMPTCRRLWTREGRRTNRYFSQRAEQVVGSREGVTILDAHALLPPEPRYFYGHAHLRPEGHEAFAAWMAPRILRALEE